VEESLVGSGALVSTLSCVSDPARKITQLDADVHEIYEMVGDIQQDVRALRGSVLRQGVRLDQIESDLQGVIDEVRGVSTDLRGMAGTQRDQDAKLDQILAALAGSTVGAPWPPGPDD
jgi:DNA anti-recombination protein RmuC